MSKGKKKSNEPLCNNSSHEASKKQSTETKSTVTENPGKKDSSNKNIPKMKYESELERTIRLKMEKLKESHKKLTQSSNTLPESSLRQRSTSQPTFSAANSTSSSRSNLKDKIPFPVNETKVNPHCNSSIPPKHRTVNIWKFNDGTTVKKIY